MTVPIVRVMLIHFYSKAVKLWRNFYLWFFFFLFLALGAWGAHFTTLESKLTEFSSSRAMVEQASILDFARITFPVPTSVIPSVPLCLWYVCREGDRV